MALRSVGRRRSDMYVPESQDPFLRALVPPADETPEQRAAREAEEEEASLVSERIDDEIRREDSIRRKKMPVKVVLLGHEGSGKTAFLRGFLEAYAPRALQEESLVWSTVIRLHLVRSVTKILDVLDNNPDNHPLHVELLRMRLRPMRSAQLYLEKLLGLAKGGEIRASAVPVLARQGREHLESRLEDAEELILLSRDDVVELWRDEDVSAKLKMHGMQVDRHSKFIFGCSHLLGGFLDDIHRITEGGYEPSYSDVMRVRSTMSGVQEYHVVVESGPESGRKWIVYDINCSSTHRNSWLPFLSDVNAIVFHVPISAFDEHLGDDQRTNWLGACYKVWTAICQSELIPKIRLILILNGCDIFRDKLQRGVSLRKFIPSYGDRANDYKTATKYIRRKFLEVSRQVSPGSEPRTVHVHLISDPDSHIVNEVMMHVHCGNVEHDVRVLEHSLSP